MVTPRCWSIGVNDVIIGSVSERLEYQDPAERIFLTVDFEGDFIELLHLAQDFNDKIHSVKLGQGFLLNQDANRIRRSLLAHGTSIYLDAKYLDDPDQMGYQVKKASDLGYRMVSVSPAAGVESLVSAARQQDGIKLVAAFSTDEDMNQYEARNLRAANKELDDDKKIELGMCNVSCIDTLSSIGNLSIIATGIRMPGDEEHDQPFVATPKEALQRGAAKLAIGRSLTAARDKFAKFERILENISEAE